MNFSVWGAEKTSVSVSTGGINSRVSLAIHCPWSAGWHFSVHVANASFQPCCWLPGSPDVEEEMWRGKWEISMWRSVEDKASVILMVQFNLLGKMSVEGSFRLWVWH